MTSADAVRPTDDGRVCPEVGSWTEEKHRLASLYATLFSSGMKDKWGKRVYVELYAGAGYSKIRASSKLIVGSPLLALSVPHLFDKYIFCEEDAENLDALKFRVKRLAPFADVAYVLGDCNKVVSDILAEIPAGSSTETVLSLCFADPFDIGLKFETIRSLSCRFVDFLVLLAVYMDANRNYEHYISAHATKVDQFLGSTTWRGRWAIAQGNSVGFPQFLAMEFARSMEALDYLPTPLHRMKRIRSDEKNLPLYYLALFSRNDRAHKFWDEVLKYGTDQTNLFET
ncbi:MAG: three-Cys-motif partner protein TcmP [Terriglobales bacterium]